MRDKVVLVTGAASGIGRATAELVAQRGGRVGVADIDPEAAGLAEHLGESALYLPLDVTDEAAWERAIASLLDRFGRLDGLVNNAGIVIAHPIADVTLAEWRRVLAVNLDGVFLGTKHAVIAMRRTKSAGAIVNVSSAAGLVGSGGAGAYCASKGGVRLFTKAVALECAAEGIRVNSVHPGAVRTKIWGSGEGWAAYVERVGGEANAFKEIGAASPVGRMAEPEEIAHAIVYLLSDEARFVTGSELVIDGGYTAR